MSRQCIAQSLKFCLTCKLQKINIHDLTKCGFGRLIFFTLLQDLESDFIPTSY